MEIIVVIVLISTFVIIRKYTKKSRWKKPVGPFPPEWRQILTEKVAYYNALDDHDKSQFEFKIREFLLNCRITGIQTEVTQTDELLVAASAVIPVFQFPEWKYVNLDEVLIYPSSFNEKFETEGPGRSILGMVGTGYMEGKMILSKKALHNGFANETDKKNTAIHEFVHLIDKADGSIDGVPELLLEKQYAIPWLDMIRQKIDEIHEDDSDINPYGGTSHVEFYAVASEYFFERPRLLSKKHPKLYELMQNVFQQDMASKKLKMERKIIGRNSPCPCDSGLKFKKCCGKIHYS